MYNDCHFIMEVSFLPARKTEKYSFRDLYNLAIAAAKVPMRGKKITRRFSPKLI